MNATDYAVNLASELVGNHRHFKLFGWHDEPDDSEEWCIVYTRNRDSSLLVESNAHAIDEVMSAFDETTVRREHHGHWACGWIDGYAIRVYTDETRTELTPAFVAYAEMAASLANDPVLDSEDFSRREYESTLENIESNASRFTVDEKPDDWAVQMFSWFWMHDQRAVDPCDGQGGYPSDKQCKKALAALGWLHADYMEQS